MAELLQFVFSGLTVGAVYALVALGFTLIYNASGVVNFAQGEFVMLGGVATAVMVAAGWPLSLAAATAVAGTAAVGVALHRLAVEPARGAPVVVLIIITIGASILLRGLAQIAFGKDILRFPAFTGEEPLRLGGATLLPQSLWVLAGAAAIFLALHLFLTRALAGKALLAVADNRLAARLVGIDADRMMTFGFAMSAAIGAVAGVLVTPIALTRFDVGVALALKGFAAAMLGGMGSPAGAVVGGLAVGMIEALTAGYLSSDYKDAAAFVVILFVLFAMPRGLFGRATVERV